MKELSIEEKSRRYDGAIKRLEDIETGKCQKTFMFTEGLFEYIFPELKESDDERIRKAIYSALQYLERELSWDALGGVDILDAYAWLEKQSEEKPAECKEKKYSKCYVYNLPHNDEMCEQCEFNPKNRKPAEWSEEDEVKINRIVACLENLNVADNDILLKDVDWLKSLKDRFVPQSKQEWSEEDESNISELCSFIIETYRTEDASKLVIWLKSIEDRLQHQSTWKPSEEQMMQLGWIARQNAHNIPGKELMSLYQDLKKLREE